MASVGRDLKDHLVAVIFISFPIAVVLTGQAISLIQAGISFRLKTNNQKKKKAVFRIWVGVLLLFLGLKKKQLSGVKLGLSLYSRNSFRFDLWDCICSDQNRISPLLGINLK